MALTKYANESAAAGFINNSTPDTIITAANDGVTIIKLVITNVTAAPVWVSVYCVPSGGSVSGDDFKVVDKLDIPAEGGNFGGAEDIRDLAGIFLETGDTLRLLAESASSLKFRVAYMEES